ncbi:MAG: D-tyrosyl-tRNA(Tyr) deacylase [Clostridia bacterium]|nr:D-tyrosyl-tRNA(Tyr) deacylase [Clostridia bacterium]
MILLCERVNGATLTVDGELISEIGKGLAVFVGVFGDDDETDVKKVAKKICELRIFENESGKMDKSVSDIGGEILLVSNFTLCGDTSHGRRPEFIRAARPEKAEPLYEALAKEMSSYVNVRLGVFGADMKISVDNDGPVNLIYSTRQ